MSPVLCMPMGGQGQATHPEVGLDDMGTPDLQFACGFAVVGQLIALIIDDAHVHKQVGPALA